MFSDCDVSLGDFLASIVFSSLLGAEVVVENVVSLRGVSLLCLVDAACESDGKDDEEHEEERVDDDDPDNDHTLGLGTGLGNRHILLGVDRVERVLFLDEESGVHAEE